MIRVTLCGLLAFLVTLDVRADDNDIDFARQIRPLLSDKCFACHGPDEKTREADLRLDIRADALASEAFVPGNVDESEFVRRITSKDADEQMPPASSHKTLNEQEINLLTRWIAEGAAYQQHWSYRPLLRPDVPASEHPESAIDALIRRQLAKQGLKPSPRADRVTLCRRLYIDLLGMPPTQTELDAFLSDKSAGAWDKLVDKVLGDQRFGERMAVYWLDLVRYADTIGYHSDTYMEVSAYRDYVINAFNDNKRFDQFTTEQLAGDLLPDPTDQQLIASGYNRLLQTTEEGGAQAKEYITIYAADRVRNVSGVWLGQTVGCAQCHDHKYDPITSRDFYSLAAFFADINERAVGKRDPNFKLLTDADKAHIQSLKTKIDGLRLPKLLESNRELAQQVRAGQQQWERAALAAADQDSSVWNSPTPSEVSATGGIEFKRQEDGTYLATGGNPDHSDYTYKINTTGTIRAVRLEIFPDKSFPRKVGFSRGNGNIVLTGISAKANGTDVKFSAASASYEQQGWPIAHTLDDSKTSGWAVDGHNKNADSHAAIVKFAQPIEFGDDEGTLEISLQHQSTHAKHNIGRFRISITDQEDAGFGDRAPLKEQVLLALRVPSDQRTPAQETQIANHYLTFAPELSEPKKQLANTEKELADYEKNLQTTLVTQTIAQPRMTRILPRGNWLDESGEVVQPAVPAFLPHEKIEDRRANRLDLARWIMQSDNPLTARTFTNRLWKLYFGRGLSRNLDDLGGQGEAPTHPELLDWLSVEFIESGWDIKHMVRLLVTSNTYQQSSVADQKLRTIDADNQWYARQGRWRMEAEFIRDSVLMLARVLVTDKVGGRSVKPYQPAGYWRHLNFPTRTWRSDKGENLYRRGLYTFWCRTFLHPSMLAFDATSREECTAQRARSNIPQQALVLLNDPMFVEAARVFAQRILAAADRPAERIEWAFREATSRPPSEAEQALLLRLFESQHQRYAASAEDAEALTNVGDASTPEHIDAAELAAWTQVARAIINAYETTSRF